MFGRFRFGIVHRYSSMHLCHVKNVTLAKVKPFYNQHTLTHTHEEHAPDLAMNWLFCSNSLVSHEHSQSFQPHQWMSMGMLNWKESLHSYMCIPKCDRNISISKFGNIHQISNANSIDMNYWFWQKEITRIWFIADYWPYYYKRCYRALSTFNMCSDVVEEPISYTYSLLSVVNEQRSIQCCRWEYKLSIKLRSPMRCSGFMYTTDRIHPSCFQYPVVE